MNLASFLSLIQIIVILVVVIFLANIALKFLNKNMIKKNKIINIIERVALSNSSSLGIVDIAGDYYLMSFTDKDSKILKKLDRKEIEDILEEIEEGEEDYLKTGKIREVLGDKFQDILGMRDKIE